MEKIKKRKTIMQILLLLLLLIIAIPFGMYFYNQYRYNSVQNKFKEKFLSNKANKIPKFVSTTLPFSHQYVDNGKSMPFLDQILVHPFQDERVVVMQTGGAGQNNPVLEYKDGRFIDIAEQLNLTGLKNEAAYCISEGDIDKDGAKEIIVGYASGIYVSKYDSAQKKYADPVKLFEIPDASIPVNIALADTRNSGNLDMYVCTFVDRKHFVSARYHDLSNKRRNLFMVNNGDGTFTEKTKEAGLELIENTYVSKFVDLNNDGKQDLVLSLNTNVGILYENLGNGTFKKHNLPIDYGFWMGLSVEKLDNKTNKYHILLSNIGDSYPEFIVRGDMKKDEVFDPNYALLEQVNGFEFKNVTKEKNLYSNVFGWGVVLADLNNNGRKDAILTENYIKFPAKIHEKFPSKGKVLLQNADGTFAPFQEETGLLNPHFGFRVITHDFTGNGYQDVIIGNIQGPMMFYKNNGIK